MAEIDPKVMAVARTQAARDRADLARLIREGRVQRDARMAALTINGAVRFREQVEALVEPPRNLAIRPKRRRRR